MLFFASDNWAGCAPQIGKALEDSAGGKASAYGTSEHDRRVHARLEEIFEHELSVFFVSTGTAANSIAIAAESRAGSVALCHSEAHVTEDECGAPEFFSGGRLARVGGRFGKIDPGQLEKAFGKFVPGFVHHGRPSMLTVTQACETGQVYSLDELSKLSAIAQDNSATLHMDGARFANALVSLDVSPAQMTWKQGVKYLSFGGTKNGCWCAEALVCFDVSQHENLSYLHKRSAQLFSKSRFIAAQFEAYLKDDLWLNLARHANAKTALLSQHLEQADGIQLAWLPQANEVFAVMKKSRAEQLRGRGATFYEFPIPADHGELVGEDEDFYRFVTSFDTTDEEIAAFADCLSA